MLKPPSLEPLLPGRHTLPNGNTLYTFCNNSIGLIKLDITLEAGSAYQSHKSQAHAASQLFGEATAQRTADQMAQFLDFHGIVVERMSDVCSGNISFYLLRRFAGQLLPLVAEMFQSPVVTPNLFEAYVSRRTTQLKTNFQKTNYLARNLHYQLLYGPDHPLGTYARPDDLQQLTLVHVQDFIHRHYSLAHAHLVLSGPIDDELLQLADQYLAPQADAPAPARIALPVSPQPLVPPAHAPLPDAVQSTIRIGRLLPFPWNSMDYTRFMVLNTVLGGYFGSRLMSNLREDKGYTYGIYSQTQIFRDSIILFIPPMWPHKPHTMPSKR